MGLSIIIYQWWRDISRERSLIGNHTFIVQLGLRSGISLFIVSELFFFLSFFWSYFHSSLRPNIELGGAWPPLGVFTFNAFGVPLLNRIILLTSGLSVTWSHHSLIRRGYLGALLSLMFTIIIGVYFRCLQWYEYLEARYTIRDRSYGSIFYIATGFHGIHVGIGTVFLSVSLVRLRLGRFSSSHHFGFEAACWYWHFVDVVWLYLYLIIYWWGNN